MQKMTNQNLRRVLLMGNRQLAIEVLVSLLSRGLEVLVVINPSDRIDDPLPSLLRFMQGKPQTRWIQPKNVRDDDAIAAIQDFAPDLLISCSYEKIIPQVLIDMPSIGSVNFHYSLLPRNRGCLPVVWGLALQEKVGVTLHWIDSGIDTGEIINQREVPTSSIDTSEVVNERCTRAAIELNTWFLNQLQTKSSLPSLPQNNLNASYHAQKFPYDRWIPWEKGADKVAAVINSLTYLPHPSARTLLHGSEIQILGPAKIIHTPMEPGRVSLLADRVQIGCVNNSVELKLGRKQNLAVPIRILLNEEAILESPSKPEYAP
jgi:methionyl-tRNA formyltransferase